MYSIHVAHNNYSDIQAILKYQEKYLMIIKLIIFPVARFLMSEILLFIFEIEAGNASL